MPHSPDSGRTPPEAQQVLRRSQLTTFWRTHAKLTLGRAITAAEEEEYLLFAPLALGNVELEG